jgi:hypothetical protein
LQQRPGFGGDGQINRRARRRAELDEMFQVELVIRRLARGENNLKGVSPAY